MKNDDANISVLMEEAKLAVDVAQRKYAAFTQYGSIGILVVVATASLASSSSREIVFLVAPTILTVVLISIMQQFGDALAISFYHDKVQQQINRHMPRDAQLRYHAVVNKRSSWSFIFVQALFAIFLVAAYVVAGITAAHAQSHRGWIEVYYWLTLLCGVGGLAAAGRDMLSSEAQAKRLYERPDSAAEGARGGLGLR